MFKINRLFNIHVLKLSRYYGLGITQFYQLQQWYEYKIENNMGGK
jgi:hypothetical protein